MKYVICMMLCGSYLGYPLQFETKFEEDMRTMNLSQFVVYLKSLPVIRIEVQVTVCIVLHVCRNANIRRVYGNSVDYCITTHPITSLSRSTWRRIQLESAGLKPNSAAEILVDYFRSSLKGEKCL